MFLNLKYLKRPDRWYLPHNKPIKERQVLFVPGSIPIRFSRVFIFWAASADTMLKCRGSREMQWTCGAPPEDLTLPFSRSVTNVQSGELVKANRAPKRNGKLQLNVITAM